jgi:hypothetical protein
LLIDSVSCGFQYCVRVCLCVAAKRLARSVCECVFVRQGETV